MKEFQIITDSTCDLTRELQQKYNIKVIPAHFMDKDGKDKNSFNDFSECDYYKNSKEFYQSLKQNPSSFTTAPPSIMEIHDVMEDFAKEGSNMIVFCLSTAMSGTYNLYQKAKEMIESKYSKIKIYIVDTMRFGPGIGLMCINASIDRQNGLSINEIYEKALKNKNNYHQMGWLDDLGFVAKKGRITSSQAFFGQLIGIKPLGEFNNCGLTTILSKAKGESQAYKAIIAYIKATIINPSNQVLILAHSIRERQSEVLKQLIIDEIKPLDIYTVELGPSCGINVGPGLLACYYVGKEISPDLLEEKQLMESILNK